MAGAAHPGGAREVARALRRVTLLAASLLPPVASSALPLAGQIRPLDPIGWVAFDDGRPDLSAGMGIYSGQRASLAGTRGTLLELGTIHATWPMGRVVVELDGTAVRVFADDSVVTAPVDGAYPSNGEARTDAGDHELSTSVLLTDRTGPIIVALRFGVRLPTTDDRIGLERDQTDFFSTVGGRYRIERVDLMAEAGIGVFGTRDPRSEQVDPLLFAGGVAWNPDNMRLGAWIVGQHDTRSGPPVRGTEDLGEVRLFWEAGRSRHMTVTLVRGFAAHSPSVGLHLESGFRF